MHLNQGPLFHSCPHYIMRSFTFCNSEKNYHLV